tara:strand:+ start:337 stop:540 length:204 start_codon:yes stop_codon:yes gene_type:complete
MTHKQYVNQVNKEKKLIEKNSIKVELVVIHKQLDNHEEIFNITDYDHLIKIINYNKKDLNKIIIKRG